MFNDGTDDTFEIPGTQSQDAFDYLSSPSVSRDKRIVGTARHRRPPGQDVTQLAATPTASVVEEIKNLDQVAVSRSPRTGSATQNSLAGLGF